jgi:hypothetical protein
MKIKIAAVVIITLLFITCSKENSPKQELISSGNVLLAILDTAGDIPLNDLGTGTFRGFIGGLYPDGINVASGSYASDLDSVCKTIMPIDTFGNPSPTGKVVFISLGGSTGGHNMRDLKTKTAGNPLTNPNLLLLNCDNGRRSATLNSQMNPLDPYWNHVAQILNGGAHSSFRQVQVVYVETDDSTKNDITFPNRPLLSKQDLEACFRVYKQKFPDIKIVYLEARTRTFGNQILFNREPAPYYFGWACKWAIEDQINGVPGTEYKGPNAVSPLITWAFYEWSDSLPRATDSFYWRFSETKDGLHASDTGEDTLSTRFQNFLLTDKHASLWFGAH